MTKPRKVSRANNNVIAKCPMCGRRFSVYSGNSSTHTCSNTCRERFLQQQAKKP